MADTLFSVSDVASMLPGGRTWLALTLFWCHIPFTLVEAHPHHRKHSGKRDSLSNSGLPSASWIWAPGAPAGNVAFLKTFSSATGKIASSATISLTAVNQFTLWVNGQPTGASSDWTSAQVLSAALNSSTNTFSVLATNDANSGAPPPGMLAAVTVKYSDGSTDSVVSDSSWLASTNIPLDFPSPASTSNFAAAAVAGSFGSGAWGDSVTVAAPNPNPPTLTGGMWIWSTSDAEYAAPAGTVGFRKTVATPNGKTAQSATILLTADNTFALYVNGIYVGAPPYETNTAMESTAWGQAQQFSVPLSAASNTFNVIVQNFLYPTTGATSPAGLVAAIQIIYADGSSDLVGTDPSWLNGAVTSASAFLAAADSALAASFNVAAMNASPWGHLSGTSNVLAAADVPSSPFTGAAASNNANTKSGGAASDSGAGANSDSTTSAALSDDSQSTGASVIASAASGSFAGSLVTSVVSFGSDVNPSQTGVAIKADLSSSSVAPTSPADGAAVSSTAHERSTPIGAIVGAVVGTLAFVIIGLAVFSWRRRHRGLQRHFQGSTQGSGTSITPFLGRTSGEPVASVSRTSIESVRRPPMAELQSQRGSINYSYPWPPSGVPHRARPQKQGAISPTKLEWEHLMWSNSGPSGGEAPGRDVDISNNNSLPIGSRATPSPGSQTHLSTSSAVVEVIPDHAPLKLMPEHITQPANENNSERDTDTLPPPSYTE
ncbi:hypothetical protein DFH07DRAFT_39750 [Mycena maculata]|uniref:Uncharacterized protein n=1 Tax=Mycena maculata TaxID=230809 RepID=A0AAD7IJE1_9AGAR|nr:hypothetical protein DFH07DRAFT_39750 [Mycena maculata]